MLNLTYGKYVHTFLILEYVRYPLVHVTRVTKGARQRHVVL